MKRSLLSLAVLSSVAALSGCAGFNFRPFGMVVCTSACTFDLKQPPAAAAEPAEAASEPAKAASAAE